MEPRYGGGFCGRLEFGRLFANSSAPSFPSIPMCPGTHETSMVALRRIEIDTFAHSKVHCDSEYGNKSLANEVFYSLDNTHSLRILK